MPIKSAETNVNGPSCPGQTKDASSRKTVDNFQYMSISQ